MITGCTFKKVYKSTVRNRYIVPQVFIAFEYKPHTIYIYDPLRDGGLLYGYTDRYNIVSIDVDDIIEKVEIK